jgi:hypothetical protein
MPEACFPVDWGLDRSQFAAVLSTAIQGSGDGDDPVLELGGGDFGDGVGAVLVLAGDFRLDVGARK